MNAAIISKFLVQWNVTISLHQDIANNHSILEWNCRDLADDYGIFLNKNAQKMSVFLFWICEILLVMIWVNSFYDLARNRR